MKGDVIGIVGQGFVGGSINEGMKEHYTIETYDKFVKSKSTCNSIAELTDKCIIMFVCLPTPMKKTGECDTSIIENVLDEIDECGNGNLVIIKSTIPVGTSRRFSEKYRNISIVFNPEFLREKTAVEDFKNQNRIILGGDRDDTMKVAMMYMTIFQPPEVKYMHVSYEVAEMTKYVTNCLLATIGSFANEMYDIAQEFDVDYNNVVECVRYDERMAKAPIVVPGHDGDRGWGGHCVLGNREVSLSECESIEIEKLYNSFKSNDKTKTRILSTDYLLKETNLKAVNNVSKRKYSGKMVRFKFANKQNKAVSFECTVDHLVPIFKAGGILLVEAGKVENGDEIFFLE